MGNVALHKHTYDDLKLSVSKKMDSTQEQDDLRAQNLKLLEEERKKLQEFQAGFDIEEENAAENKEDVDARSIYVGNVEYATQPQELETFFKPAGLVKRVNIMVNKFTGQPKGYAYVEFAEPSMVSEALLLNGGELHGRPVKIMPKRTNIPGMNRGRGRGRGRGGRGRGGRGRGRGRFTPY